MIHIDEILPMDPRDLQEALAGVWGTDESSETYTELALGSLNVRLYQDTTDVSPQGAPRGNYVPTLAILSFMDGTSVTETLSGPKTYAKTIKMGVLIARQLP